MKLRFKQLVAMMAALLISATFSPEAQACAACFGQSDDPMAHGMNAGIFSLLAVVGVVLLGFFAFMIYLVVRGSKYSGVMEKRAEEIRAEILRNSPQVSGAQS